MMPYLKVIIVKFHSYASHIGHIFHSREPFKKTTMMMVDSQVTLTYIKILFYIDTHFILHSGFKKHSVF